MIPGASSQTSGLCKYILNTLYDRFSTLRTPLSDKWERNRLAYKGDPAAFKAWREADRDGWESRAVMNITKQKTVQARCLIADAVFKGGRVQFMLTSDDEGALEQKASAPEEDEHEADSINEQEALIHRQFQTCNAVDELDMCLGHGAKSGIYFAKRYVTTVPRQSFVEVMPGLHEMTDSPQRALGIEAVSPWQMYWDIEAGTDLRAGRGCIQKSPDSAYGLRSKRGRENSYWLDGEIDKVLSDLTKTAEEAGTGTGADEPARRLHRATGRTLEKYECWVRVPRHLVDTFEAELRIGVFDESVMNDAAELLKGDEVWVHAMIHNNRITRYHQLNNARMMPYYCGVFERDDEGLLGLGVPDNVENEQQSINGALQNYENNKKLASSLILAMKPRLFKKGLSENLRAVNIVELTKEARSIKDALEQFVIQDVGDSLLKMIELELEFSDLSSFIPRSQQGQVIKKEETLGEFQIRMDKSGKYIGDVIRRFDKFVGEIVTDFYTDNMLDPDSAAAKENYQVKALGFTSYENKVIRLQKLMQMLNLLISNEQLMGISKLRWLVEEIAKALDIEPDQVLLTEEEKETKRRQTENDPNHQAQMELLGAQVEQAKTTIERDRAETLKITEEIKLKAEEIALKRAETIQKLEAAEAA